MKLLLQVKVKVLHSKRKKIHIVWLKQTKLLHILKYKVILIISFKEPF